MAWSGLLTVACLLLTVLNLSAAPISRARMADGKTCHGAGGNSPGFPQGEPLLTVLHPGEILFWSNAPAGLTLQMCMVCPPSHQGQSEFNKGV